MRRILNIGCGNDFYGTDFVDLHPSRDDILKVDIDIQRLPYEDNIFDEVYARALFEHLRNSMNFLKEVRRVLKSKGRILMITDNAHFLGYHFIGRMHDGNYIGRVSKKGFERYEDDNHYAFFTPSHLKNHLKSAGFYNINVSYLKNWNPHMVGLEWVVVNIAHLISKKHGSAHLLARGLKP